MINDSKRQKSFISARLIDVESAAVVNSNEPLFFNMDNMDNIKMSCILLTEQLFSNQNDELYVKLNAAGIAVQIKNANAPDIGVNWTDSRNLCENSILGGYSDWRLPTKDEMASIYENRVKIGGFTSDKETRYWTSTKKSKKHYVFDIKTGATELKDTDDTYYNKNKYCIRCVRTLNH